jgi:DNA-binding response OmpR family regulator
MATIKPTVAIASTDPRFATELSERLVSENCRVMIVSNMGRLAEQIKEAEVHVAVVDLDLPDGQCRRLVEGLKSLDRHLGLIVAAKYCSEEDERYLRASGVSYMAFKPMEPGALTQIVRESARKAARQRHC